MWPTLITLWLALSGNTPQRPPPRRRPAFRRPSSRPRLETLEDRCLLSLDPTFGSGGLVITAIGTNGTDGAAAVIVQPDGKIVAGGSSTVNGYDEFTLVRYNANGTLDSSFGKNGIVQTKVGNDRSYISGLALQSDGKIAAVGSADSSRTTAAFAVVRYNPNGSLDTTFGGGKHPSGIVLTNVGSSFGGSNGPSAVTIQGDGKIDVAGSSHPNKSNLQDFTLVRYNANGTLDTTFGPSNSGIVVTQVGTSASSANALAIQSDGKIVATGRSYEGSAGGYTEVMGAVRYTPTGQLDSSFGTNGAVTGLIPTGATGAVAGSVLVLGNGDIIVGGNVGGNSLVLTLARLTSTGQLDTTFGSAGFAFDSTIQTAAALALGANGDLLAAGSALLLDKNHNIIREDAGVTAFLPGGAPDTCFGTSGTAIADFGYLAGIQTKAMAIQGDGRIVVAGLGQAGYELARFLPLGLQIDSFTASPNPVTAGSSLTLTASNIIDANAGSTITQVAFYVQLNGSNTLLGYGSQTSPGVWTFTFTVNLAPGSYTLFAQAEDNYGIFSDLVGLTLTVQ